MTLTLGLAEEGTGLSPKGSLDIRKPEPGNPKLSFVAELSDANHNSICEGEEEIALAVTIRNDGNGSADGVRIVLSGGSGLVGRLGSEKIVGSVAAGASVSETLSATLPPMVPKEEGTMLTVKVKAVPEEWSCPDSQSFLVAVQPKKGGGLLERKYVDVDLVPDRRQTDENSVAVVIGVSKYRDETVPEVMYAERDAATVRSYLENVCGVKSANIFELSGANATKGDLDDVFKSKLPLKVKKNGTVYVYFAGHGSPGKDGQPKLVPWDATATTDTKLYPVSDLVQEANEWQAQKTVVMLDICFAGKNRVLKPASGQRPLVPATYDRLRSSSKCVVFTASDSTQTANDLPDVRHGLFTYYVLKALKGEADNNPKDGWVTLKELYDYVRANVSEEAADKLYINQDPTIILPPGVEQTVYGWKIGKSE
jgi:hypothetical protein